MVSLLNDPNIATDSNNFVIFGTFGLLFCMIVTTLNVKFKWFKHRLNFNGTTTTEIIPRGSIINENNQGGPQIIKATFRPSTDFDKFVEIEPPKTLPAVRITPTTDKLIIKKPRAPPIPSKSNNTNDKGNKLKENLSPSDKIENSIGNYDEFRSSTTIPQSETNNNVIASTNNQIEISKQLNETKLLPPPAKQLVQSIEVSEPKQYKNNIRHKKTKQKPTDILNAEKIKVISKEIPTNEPKVEIQSSPKKLTKNELKQNKQSKLNSFLYQIETPQTIPPLKHSKSLPDLQEQNDEIYISTAPSISSNSKKKRSTSVVTLNESVTKSTPPKKGFFSFLSNNKQSKKTNKNVDEIINKPKIDEPKKYKKIKVLKATMPNEKIKRSTKDKKKKVGGLENTRPSVIFSDNKSSSSLDKTKPRRDQQKSSIHKSTNDKQIQLKLNKNGSPSSNDSQSPIEEKRHTHLRNPIVESNHKSSNEIAKKGIKQHNKNKLMQDIENVSPTLAPRTSTSIHENKSKSKSLKTDKKISSQKSSDIKDITMKKPKIKLIDSGGGEGAGGGGSGSGNDVDHNESSNYDHLEFKKNNESPDPWDLVAKHRQHTATISKSKHIKLSSTVAPTPQLGVSTVDQENFQSRQIQKLNKPKTMREMKKNHMEVMINQRESNALKLRKKDNDSETDTEA